MRMNTPQSPLRPFALPANNQLSPFQAIGLVTGLAINHDSYANLSVEDMVSRLIPAFHTGNAKIFFDDAQRPYGYASWAYLSENKHREMLNRKAHGQVDPVEFFQSSNSDKETGTYLWFLDLICPFFNPLLLYRLLKEALPNYSNAYLPQALGGEYAVRRLW